MTMSALTRQKVAPWSGGEQSSKDWGQMRRLIEECMRDVAEETCKEKLESVISYMDKCENREPTHKLHRQESSSLTKETLAAVRRHSALNFTQEKIVQRSVVASGFPRSWSNRDKEQLFARFGSITKWKEFKQAPPKTSYIIVTYDVIQSATIATASLNRKQLSLKEELKTEPIRGSKLRACLNDMLGIDFSPHGQNDIAFQEQYRKIMAIVAPVSLLFLLQGVFVRGAVREVQKRTCLPIFLLKLYPLLAVCAIMIAACTCSYMSYVALSEKHILKAVAYINVASFNWLFATLSILTSISLNKPLSENLLVRAIELMYADALAVDSFKRTLKKLCLKGVFGPFFITTYSVISFLFSPIPGQLNFGFLTLSGYFAYAVGNVILTRHISFSRAFGKVVDRECKILLTKTDNFLQIKYRYYEVVRLLQDAGRDEESIYLVLISMLGVSVLSLFLGVFADFSGSGETDVGDSNEGYLVPIIANNILFCAYSVYLLYQSILVNHYMDNYEKTIEMMAADSLFTLQTKEEIVQLDRFLTFCNLASNKRFTRWCVLGTPLDKQSLLKFAQLALYVSFIVFVRIMLA